MSRHLSPAYTEEDHKKYMKVYNGWYRRVNKDKLLVQKKEYRDNNQIKVKKGKQKCTTENRLTVLSYYSGGTMKCLQCECDDVDMLVLDHINGGGKAHVREIGGPGGLCVRMIQEGYPPILQVLCANCNQKKDMERRRGIISPNKKSERRRELRNERRIQVLSHYSGGVPKCLECGNTDFDVLTLDHIDNDGAEHKRKINGEFDFCSALIRDKMSPDFKLQVYCANHNHKKEMLRRKCDE